MEDLILYETGQGGELRSFDGELEMTEGFGSAVYISLFGGEKDDSFWANDLLFNGNDSEVIKSRTPESLQKYSLTKSNLSRIKTAVEQDLEWLKEFATISVDLQLTGFNKLRINIKITEPESQNEENFSLNWDGIKNELI